MRPLHGFFSVIVLLGLLAVPLGASGEPGGSVFIVQGAPGAGHAPSFTLHDLDGRQRSLEEFGGRVVLLHFWASWCEPCIEEFPAIEALSALFKDRDLTVIAVAEDSVERARSFVDEHGFSSTVLVDRWGKVMREYGVMVIPYSVVIGRDGGIKGVISGPRDYSGQAAVEYFEKVLSER